MSEQDRAIVRACLRQVQVGLAEAKQVKAWWVLLTDGGRQEWKNFSSLVDSYLRQMGGDVWARSGD